MKPTLIEQPYGNTISTILKTFENGKPLSADQINFLARHERILSQYAFDPVIKYYLKGYYDKKKKELSFTLTNEKLTEQTAQRIKRYVQELLKKQISHIDLRMTFEQFQHFKTVGVNELIFWHGNQFLTGAPFYPGGIPHLVYVQWGNLFGIVKLQILLEEKAIKGNVLIYFEAMKERSLYQCIKDYSRQMKHELPQQNTLVQTEKLIQQPSLVLRPPYFHEIP